MRVASDSATRSFYRDDHELVGRALLLSGLRCFSEAGGPFPWRNTDEKGNRVIVSYSLNDKHVYGAEDDEEMDTIFTAIASPRGTDEGSSK